MPTEPAASDRRISPRAVPFVSWLVLAFAILAGTLDCPTSCYASAGEGTRDLDLACRTVPTGDRNAYSLSRRIVDDREHHTRPMRLSVEKVAAPTRDQNRITCQVPHAERREQWSGGQFLPRNDGGEIAQFRGEPFRVVQRLPLCDRPIVVAAIGGDCLAIEAPTNAYAGRGAVIDEATFESKRPNPSIERDPTGEFGGDETDPCSAGKLGGGGRSSGRLGAVACSNPSTSGIAPLQNGEDEQSPGRNGQLERRIGEQFGLVRQITHQFDQATAQTRFFLPLAFLLLCLGLSARGWKHVYDDRRLQGARWLCGATVPAALALWLR